MEKISLVGSIGLKLTQWWSLLREDLFASASACKKSSCCYWYCLSGEAHSGKRRSAMAFLADRQDDPTLKIWLVGGYSSVARRHGLVSSRGVDIVWHCSEDPFLALGLLLQLWRSLPCACFCVIDIPWFELFAEDLSQKQKRRLLYRLREMKRYLQAQSSAGFASQIFWINETCKGVYAVEKQWLMDFADKQLGSKKKHFS